MPSSTAANSTADDRYASASCMRRAGLGSDKREKLSFTIRRPSIAFLTPSMRSSLRTTALTSDTECCLRDTKSLHHANTPLRLLMHGSFWFTVPSHLSFYADARP